jgi:hypothetical protein
MPALVNNKVVLASAPVVMHHKANEHRPEYPFVLEVCATQEITAKVMVSIRFKCLNVYVVSAAVQYADGDKFYKKHDEHVYGFAAALKLAYGLSRKLYRVTASRALAGLLHDSVVPATEDLDC